MTDEERAVLRRLEAEIIEMRDTAAQLPDSETNDRIYRGLAYSAITIAEYIASGWNSE